MARNDTNIVCSAGEHFVAFRLAQLGFTVALTRAGSLGVDILVTNRAGSKTVAIQVKTAEFALRQRGRGENRIDDHLEFSLGAKAADINNPRYLYAFVDLKGRSPDSIPDVYIVPSADIFDYCEGWAKNVPLVRWHPKVNTVARYLNNWSMIERLLR